MVQKIAVEKLQFHLTPVLNKPSQKHMPSSDTDENGTLNLTGLLNLLAVVILC